MRDKRSEQPSPVLLENREWRRVETPAFLWLEDNGVCIFVAATSRASAFVLFTTGDTSLVSVNSRAGNHLSLSLSSTLCPSEMALLLVENIMLNVC